jgi:hypothetical protein
MKVGASDDAGRQVPAGAGSPPAAVSRRTFDGRQPGGSAEPRKVRSVRTRTATP